MRAFVGPGRAGAPGTAVMTSDDYAAAVGSDHVLYLIGGSDGQLETNACIGSHAGPPNALEAAYFGAGTSPNSGAGMPRLETVFGAPATLAEVAAIWPVLILVVLGSAIVVVYVVRRRGVQPPRSP